MVRLFILLLCLIVPSYAATVMTTTESSNGGHKYSVRPDLHAPITVMGDHTHNKGASMISYRFMTMPMDALRQGTESVSRLDAFSNEYMNAPKSMTMDMHMIGGMYGLSDKVTLMAMISHRKNTMTSIKMMDRSESTVEASGIGDVTVSAMVKVIERDDL